METNSKTICAKCGDAIPQGRGRKRTEHVYYCERCFTLGRKARRDAKMEERREIRRRKSIILAVVFGVLTVLYAAYCLFG